MKSFRLSILYLLFGLTLSAAVSAATPTSDQIRLFQSLPQDQQSQLLKQYQSQSSAKMPLGTPLTPSIEGVNDAPKRKRISSTSQPSQDQTDPGRSTRIESSLNKSLESGFGSPSDKEIKADRLRQFGYDLFADDDSSFAPSADMPVPTDYVLGPGDNVLVELFGMESTSFNLVVSRDGTLNFPGIGVISVAGMSFDQAKSTINSRLTKQYIGVQSNITMGGLRSIRVFVLGDVARPGSYTVSSLSTMTNALFMSGGVKPIGSLRRIQLKRAGKLVTTLDLYDLLMRGDTSADARLKPGDVIFVPSIGSTVGVAGEVVRPAIYELRNEKSVGEIIKYAGGLLSNADPVESTIERINDKRMRTVINVDLSKRASLDRSVANGDVINVRSVLDRRDNSVELSGHVRRSGIYQWRNGLRLTDVLPSYDNLYANSDIHYVLIQREMPPSRKLQFIGVDLHLALSTADANIKLFPRDRVIVLSLDKKRSDQVEEITNQLAMQTALGQPDPLVNIQGNIQFPGKYPYFQGMRVSDLLRAAVDIRPETDMQYALIQRISGSDRRMEILSVIPEQVIANRGGDADIVLQPRDTLIILSDKVASSDQAVVNLAYSVKSEKGADVEASQAGVEPEITVAAVASKNDTEGLKQAAIKNERLKDDVKAGLFAGVESVSDRLKTVSTLVERIKEQADVSHPVAVVSVFGNVRFPGDYPLTKGMRIADLVRAGGRLNESALLLRAELVRFVVVGGESRQTDVVSIDLGAALQGNVSANIELRPADRLHVMQVSKWANDVSVEIKGEVKHPGKYTMLQGETLAQLLQRAGGVVQGAYPDGAYFTREELKKKELQTIQDMIKRLRADLASLSFDQVKGDADKMMAYNAVKEMLAQLESAEPTGRLVINLPEILAGNAQADVILKPGDTLVVPSFRQEISVLGEVFYPTSHLYESGIGLKNYVNKSGGLTARADDERIYVVRSNGSVEKADRGWLSPSVRLRPGDTVVVPFDTDRINKLKLWTSVSQIVYQLAITMASLRNIGLYR